MLKYMVSLILLVLIFYSCTPAGLENDFKQERLARIKKDFTKTEEEVKQYIQEYIPDVSEAQMRTWEKSRALEWMEIEGEKRYFKYAARNLFRIDPQARDIWNKAHPDQSVEGKLDLDQHNRKIMQLVLETGQSYVNPIRMQITYSISVDANAVPAGENVRCWIPYPIEIPGRQIDINLIKTNPKSYQLAPADQKQRTIYFEREAQTDKPTKFSVTYAYTSYGTFTDIDADKVEAVTDQDGLQKFLSERPPHIVFHDSLIKLSQNIVGDETNPYRIAQKLFAWVDQNIPWASAREYSTISNLSYYPYLNKHGDCGLQTMLFITLCRINGIPARWQSGWEFQPPDDSMHDWGMVYFKPYGWVPMDVTYGLRKTDDEKLKWFYLSGMDSYRTIFNEDYAQPFSPEKKFFRSETIDSQRGEVEWDGGNLYFDQWDWEIKWELMTL